MKAVKFFARILLVLAILAVSCPATPSRSAPAPQAKFHPQQTSPAQDPVDINAATLEQLMKVPGMTRTWAARIIRFRPYRAKNELLDRGILTSQVYDRIKDHIIAHRLRNN